MMVWQDLRQPVVMSWSGGKDAMLALCRLREAGVPVHALIAMCEPDAELKSHGVPRELMQAQAEALGLPLWLVDAPSSSYLPAWQGALARAASEGVGHVAFGDIDLQAHRDWQEKVLGEAGLQAHFPLWGEARAKLGEELLARGVRARVVALDAKRLPERFLGQEYSHDFVASLPEGVCPVGEDGEFHTFVFDGPGMGWAVAHRVHSTRLESPAFPPGAQRWQAVLTGQVGEHGPEADRDQEPRQ